MSESSITKATRTARAVLSKHARDGTLAAAIAALGMPPTPPGQRWSVHKDAVLFWREFVTADGLVLDPKVWKIDSNAQAVAAKAIEWAFLHGKDGSKAAAHFLYESGESCDVTVDSCANVVDRVTALFTREINRAFKNADAAQVKQRRTAPKALVRELTQEEQTTVAVTVRKALEATPEKDRSPWRFILELFSK